MRKIKSWDKVKVISGKYKWDVSKVSKVDWELVVVDKVNVVKKAKKGTGFIEITKPIHISNIMYYCDKCNKPVRVSIKINEKWKKVRICTKCKTEIK